MNTPPSFIQFVFTSLVILITLGAFQYIIKAINKSNKLESTTWNTIYEAEEKNEEFDNIFIRKKEQNNNSQGEVTDNFLKIKHQKISKP